MDGLKNYNAVLTERFGTIDNMKFLLGTNDGISKEDVANQLQLVADALNHGSCVPSSNFAEPGINDQPLLDLLPKQMR